MDTAEHDIRRGTQPADVVALGLAIHAPDPRPEWLVASGLVDLVGDADKVERLGGPVVHLGALGNKFQDNPFCLGGVRRPEDADSIRLERGDSPFHSELVGPGAPTPP